MQHLIIIEVPREAEDLVYQLRDRYKFRDIKLKPHITLVPPFVFKLKEDELLERLNSVKMEPFKLTITGVGFLTGRNKVLYLDVHVSERLQQLYARMIDLLESDSWKPYGRGPLFKSELVVHITITKRLKEPEFVVIKRKLKDLDFGVSWIVNSFWLYSCPDDGNWQPVREFKLG